MGETLGSPSMRLLREGGGQSWHVLWKVGDTSGREPRDSAALLTSLLGAAPEKALNRRGAWGLSHESVEPSVGWSESGSGSCGGSQQSREQLCTRARGGRSELGGGAPAPSRPLGRANAHAEIVLGWWGLAAFPQVSFRITKL